MEVPRLLTVELELHPDFLNLSKRRRYLVAVSGGRDSVALLHALMAAGFRNFVVCHLNHGLRGRDSGNDARFVRRLAEKNHLAHEIQRMDVAALMQKTGDSMELAARNARHTFFSQCAKKHRCHRILLGHHADDAAETILFNLLRGSAGLKGIQFSSAHRIGGQNIEFLRPLIQVTRKHIDQFVSHHQIDYREDTTNAQPVAARNRLRNEAIPLLEEIMGREIGPALLRAEKISTARDDCLRELLGELELEDPQGRLFLPKVTPLPRSAQLIVIHTYLKKHHTPEISHSLLENCQKLINDSSVSKTNLPGGRYLRSRAKRLFIE